MPRRPRKKTGCTKAQADRRAAEHAARLKKQEQAEAAKAGERARNIAEYEQKRREVGGAAARDRGQQGGKSPQQGRSTRCRRLGARYAGDRTRVAGQALNAGAGLAFQAGALPCQTARRIFLTV